MNNKNNLSLPNQIDTYSSTLKEHYNQLKSENSKLEDELNKKIEDTKSFCEKEISTLTESEADLRRLNILTQTEY